MKIQLKDQLAHYQNSRRMPDWQPKQALASKPALSPTQDEIIRRCLSFASLELQVRDWVLATADGKELPKDDEAAIKANLRRNSLDEEKHDKVLAYLSDYYEGAHESTESNSLVRRWKLSNAHPIAAAYALECGLFFTILPALIKCGDVYAATVGQWINDDERVHVETNLAIMKRLGLKLNPDLLKLVFDSVSFIFSPAGAEDATYQAKRAVKRVVSGRDKDMLVESVPTTIAFFEQHNKMAIVY
jgi:hypothetical protein